MERLPPPFHGLWAEKPITAVMFLLPQDGVNTVYLVIRMLFLDFFFFLLAELVFSLPGCCPAGAAGSGGSQGVLGWEQQHPMPPTC